MKKIFSIILTIVILGISNTTFAWNHIILEEYLGRDNYNSYNNYRNYNRNNYNNYNNYNNHISYDNRYWVNYETQYFPQNTNATRPYNNYNYNYNYYYNYNYNYNNNYYNRQNNNYTSPYTLPVVSSQSRYPGCSKDDLYIGGQIWASCNSLDRNSGSDFYSGWFYNGAMYAAYSSNNGKNNTLYTQDKNFTNIRNWTFWPCANGYRLPTRWEWETAQNYARNNNTTIARLLNLPYNGWYMAYKDIRWNISVDARLNIGGAYWTSTAYYDTPYVMHLGSTLANYRTDGTDMSYMDSQYRWQYTDNSLELVPGLYQEIANVRCIKNT